MGEVSRPIKAPLIGEGKTIFSLFLILQLKKIKIIILILYSYYGGM